jgi:hypothetical protein
MENAVKSEPRTITADDWIVLAILTVFAVYFYVFMEWLFFVTKPSFMSALGFLETMQVLWVAPLPITAAALIGLLAFLIPAR